MASRGDWVMGLALATAVGVLAGRAEAQEYCIACTEPAAVYRCVIDGARPGGGQSLQMLCITSMAKDGNHATCGIKRGTVFDCDGPVKRVPWSGAELPAETPGTATAADKPEPDQFKKANENVKESFKSTGDAIGNATKKSWNCLTSLFKEC
jgi:hypothetical protein